MRVTGNYSFAFDHHVHFQDQKSVPPTHIREQRPAPLCEVGNVPRYRTSLTPPLQVYLDPRHLGWMTDSVLQHVLSDLRPLYASVGSVRGAFADVLSLM